MEDSKDPSKWKSRKLHFSLLCLALITLGFVMAAYFPAAQAMYVQYVAGILGVLTLYLGGNVGNKYVVAKATPPPPEEEDGLD